MSDVHLIYPSLSVLEAPPPADRSAGPVRPGPAKAVRTQRESALPGLSFDPAVWLEKGLNEDRLFTLAIVTSFLAHAVILASFFYTRIFPDHPQTIRPEVVYLSLPEDRLQSRPQIRSLRSGPAKQQPSLLPDVLKTGPRTPDDLFASSVKTDFPMDLHRKTEAQIDLFHEKVQVSVPMIKSGKITNPSFLQYQEKIRNKIRDRAISYISSLNFDNGEVYLSFMIMSTGELREVRIVDQKTRASNSLRGVALRSIKESHPFPPFPSELDYKELPFNIVISFKLNGGTN